MRFFDMSSYHTREIQFEGLIDLQTIFLPETNIAPENRPFQKEISIPTIHFQVLWEGKLALLGSIVSETNGSYIQLI